MPIIINKDPYQSILHNGIEHQGIINALEFEEIVDDLLFPLPGAIPVLNPR
jgi:hypothetical protein